MISFDGEPSMSVEAFLEDCQRLLPKEDAGFITQLLSHKILDYAILQRLVTENRGEINHNNEVFQKGLQFNRTFRNELAWFRAEKAGKDPNNFIRGMRSTDPVIGEVIRVADREENLFEAERILDRFRWSFLEELESGHQFDIEFITLYGLKLSILERYQILRSDQGAAIFKEIKNIEIPEIV